MMTHEKNCDHSSKSSESDKQAATKPYPLSTQPQYQNSLLAAVAYLDLANALDFPANVWNHSPLPLVALVLMGLGGSISILTTFFAFWDMKRSWQNVKALREERGYLNARLKNEERLTLLENAWLGINYRELGWEIIDRMFMDAFMAAAGILVGTGCLMAMKGDIEIVFKTSNYLSGYIGNSFVAAYGLINAVWSVYMWRKAHLNVAAVSRHRDEIDSAILVRLRQHARRHKIYALVNGLSVFVAGVASEVSSTLWEGYVVLIPCIAGSISCNYFWRHCLGYNRTLFTSRPGPAYLDIPQRLQLLLDIRSALKDDTKSAACIDEVVATSVKDERGLALEHLLVDLGADLVSRVPNTTQKLPAVESKSDDTGERQLQMEHAQALNRSILSLDKMRFRDEERFLLELYGYYLVETDMHFKANQTKE